MATVMNPGTLPGIRIGYAVGSVADWLRRITVRISGPKGLRGSGVIWRADGLIVTNAHVASANLLEVTLADTRTFTAKVTAREPDVDLAALQVDALDLPFAGVRSSRECRAGELVLAMGNPADGEGALSAGIVHRSVGDGICLFADIRLAPGNSGGPLADAQGTVLGINSAIFGGLGCAITSDTVKAFLKRAGLAEAA